ncbi:MAG: hypothetical protein K2Q25_00525, partial [Mycobacteriaceae bacterium]|nr:hypothetical protein [Mycobacteriaceae bacterium]
FIFGRPRPLPRQRRADPTYTLICEEPVNMTTDFAALAEAIVTAKKIAPLPEILSRLPVREL